MYCTNCGKQVNDGDKFCKFCGAPLEQEEKTWNEEFEAKDVPENVGVLRRIANFFRVLILVIICGIICTVLGVGSKYLYEHEIYPRIIYSQAQDAYEEGRYQDAIDLYDLIVEFSDSGEQRSKAVYALADEYDRAGDYLTARSLFESIADYEDSSKRADGCTYSQAKALIAKKQYTDAIALLEEIPDYEDSRTLVQECKYQMASDLVRQKSYEKALDLFREIIGYLDVDDRMAETTYLLAMQEVEAQEYGTALEHMSGLAEQGYGDSADQVEAILDLVAADYCDARSMQADERDATDLRLLLEYGFFQYEPLSEDDQDAAIALVNPALIDLKRYYGGGWTSGSGVIYRITESQVYFLSVEHVVEEMTSGATKVSFMDGTTVETTIEYMSELNSECSMFSISVKDIPAQTLIGLHEVYVDEDIYHQIKKGDTVIKYAENWSGQGEDVLKISTYQGMNAYEVSGKYVTEDGYIVTTHSAIQGMSGTAAFDCKGRLVGLVCFIHPNKGTDYECRIDDLSGLYEEFVTVQSQLGR